MKTATVSSLKAKLSAYLSHVKSGEEVLVTDRGRPVARIVPCSVERDGDSLCYLAREGIVRLPKRQLSKRFLGDLKKLPRPDAKLVQALLDEREAGW